MILSFKLYSAAGATALLAAPSDAFAPAAFHRNFASRTLAAVVTPLATPLATPTVRHANLNPDWDNDDFLSSLGGGEDEREEVNQKYYNQAENRKAMDEWRARKFAEQQTPSAPSPELFRKMGMAEPPRQGQQPPQPQMQPPQQIKQSPPQKQQALPQLQKFFDVNGNPVSMPMVYDQNGNLVPLKPQQPQMQQQSPPPAQLQMPPQINPDPAMIDPTRPPKTKGTDSPRPVGFNPDAYTMSNTADVYFAQLKQDSKVRKIAWMSGDVDTANKVFADESVKQIGESWNENPYTKEKNLAEARAEIEGTVRAQTQEDDAPVVSTGISYKQSLERMRAKRVGGGGSPAGTSRPTPKLEPPVASAPQKLEQPNMATAPKVQQPAAKAPAGTSTIATPAAVMPPAKAAVAAAIPAVSLDEVRGKVRTLQGLLLKHRGGPGFGAGRLKAPEAQRLEDTLEEVKEILRSEIGKWDHKPAAATHSPPEVKPKPQLTAAQTVPLEKPKPPASQQAAEAGVPPSSQAATLVSQPAAVGGPPDPLAGSVACVEAALKLYKESSPMDRKAMVIPLREALMAAASASNKYIAESELRTQEAVMAAGPPAAVDTAQPENFMGKGAQNAGVAVATPPVIDQEENERMLEDAYNALEWAGGEGGRLGLKNINGDEANALADKLVAMRGVLLDELNNSS